MVGISLHSQNMLVVDLVVIHSAPNTFDLQTLTLDADHQDTDRPSTFVLYPKSCQRSWGIKRPLIWDWSSAVSILLAVCASMAFPCFVSGVW
jgi:hypothetical protein